MRTGSTEGESRHCGKVGSRHGREVGEYESGHVGSFARENGRNHIRQGEFGDARRRTVCICEDASVVCEDNRAGENESKDQNHEARPVQA